jgi:hypothetical protein
MFRDLTDALKDLVDHGYNWTQYQKLPSSGRNRAQAQGSHLEDIVKDILCGIEPSDINGRELLLEKYLAYQGSPNNPPDAMFRGGNSGDAFEVKKSESKSVAALDLNSSHPYSHLTSDLTRLTREAISCETWDKRDIHYVIGNVVTSETINNWIWFVQGNVFSADLETFRSFESDIKSHIEEAIVANALEPGITNELGRINGVDPRENTDLRIRPMWGTKSPMKLFKDLPGVAESDLDGLVVHCILRKTKWESLLEHKSEEIKVFWSKSKSPSMSISDVLVPDPDDLQQEIEAKLIRIVVNLS